MSAKNLKVRKRSKLIATPKRRHHLDRRADLIVASEIEADDNELLTTKQVADWWRVSEEWLEIGRCKNYGPKFIRVAHKMIRYRRGDCRMYLEERTHSSTAEYMRRLGGQYQASV